MGYRIGDLVQRYRQSINSPYKPKDFITLLVTFLFISALPVTVYLTQQPTRLESKAASSDVTSQIEPATQGTPVYAQTIPGKTTLVSPLNTFIKTSGEFRWQAVSGSTMYKLWIKDPGNLVFSKWYKAADLTNLNGILSVNPNLTLAQGEVRWYVQTWNENGEGPWSDEGKFRIDSRDFPPVAEAGENKVLTLTGTNTSVGINLNGTSSYDPDGTITNYLWDGVSADGTKYSLSGAEVTQDLPSGTYKFTLKVTDNSNLQSVDTVLVLVEPASGKKDKLYYVEPYDFHYPDEKIYENTENNFLNFNLTLGESEPATFVYVPVVNRKNVRLTLSSLRSNDGKVLPASFFKAGVVVYMNRAGDEYRDLNSIWRGGQRAGTGVDGPYYGLNKDLKDHLPVLPVAIVPDEIEFEKQKASALGHLTAKYATEVKTEVTAGTGKQFWVTASIPPDFKQNQASTVYRGEFYLTADDTRLAIPVFVEVFNVSMDTLDQYNKFMGVMRTFKDVEPQFKDTVMNDLKSHGVNALREELSVPAEYDYVKQYGIKTVINPSRLLGADDYTNISNLGFLPLVYGIDEPGDPSKTTGIEDHINISKSVQSQGGKIGASGWLLDLRDRISPFVHQNWWNQQFRTWGKWYKDYDSDRNQFDSYLDSLRQSGANKLADMESHYAPMLNFHYPLATRLLYGFWLFNSNLDGGFPWGYAVNAAANNPFTNTTAYQIAFPAEFTNADGSLHHGEMLPSYVWEAYREAIDDLRLALSAKRLVAGDPDKEAIFNQLMAPYARLDEDGWRLDHRRSNINIRNTRYQLLKLVSGLSEQTVVLSQKPTIADTTVKSANPTTNYGTSRKLSVDGSPTEITYLKFDLTPLAARTVLLAKLMIRVANGSSSTQVIEHVDDTSWSETSMTYNNRPPVGSVITSFIGGSKGVWKEVDITAGVAAKAGQLASYAIDSTGSDGLDFYSRENAANKPKLIITYR